MYDKTELSTYVNDYYAVKDTPLPTVLLSISHELYMFIMSISLGVVCQTIAVFGVITNVLNIIVFIKQGFSETINISLLALTFSDLLSLISIIWSNICYTADFRDSITWFHTEDVPLITGAWPHVIFTRTTGWITAFISFERCVCVILPLKVKAIFTQRRHIFTMVTIFVVTIGCASLGYVLVGLGWRFYPERNKTLFGVVHNLNAYGEIITNSVNYAINGVLMPVSSFLMVVIFTGILVVKLNHHASWRNSNSYSVNQDSSQKPFNLGNTSTKNRRVAKMVVSLSAVFVACFIPAVVMFISACVEPEINYVGRYKNIFMITFSVSFIAEVINSSTNIFVYFFMSTKYRQTFHILFRIRHTPVA